MNARHMQPQSSPQPPSDLSRPVEALEEGIEAVSAPRARLPWWSLRHRGRAAWTIHLVVLAVFAVAALIAHTLRADSFDVWVTSHVQRWYALDWQLRAASWVGFQPQETIVDAVIIVGLYALRYWVEAVFLLLSVAGGGLLDQIVKTLVARPRPGGTGVHVVNHLGSYSFPSGHVMSYVSLFGFLAYLAWIELRPGALRWVIVGVCVAMLLVVGPSRIYLGAHWATDVLGAYLLGALWLSVVLRAFVAWQDSHPSTPSGQSPTHTAHRRPAPAR